MDSTRGSGVGTSKEQKSAEGLGCWAKKCGHPKGKEKTVNTVHPKCDVSEDFSVPVFLSPFSVVDRSVVYLKSYHMLKWTVFEDRAIMK